MTFPHQALGHGDGRRLGVVLAPPGSAWLRGRRQGKGGVGRRAGWLILDDVPIISFFFGIVIRMFYKEHEPAHFHGEHQTQQAKFDFDGKLVAGEIRSKTALRLIRQWAVLHRAELEANWTRMKAGRPLDKIPPLD